MPFSENEPYDRQAEPLISYRNGADDARGRAGGFALTRIDFYCALFSIALVGLMIFAVYAVMREWEMLYGVLFMMALIGAMFVQSLRSLIQMRRGRKRF